MKDIVVAIDFSKGSIHALEYAIELANISGTNVNMVWVDNISVNEVALTTQAKEMRNEAKRNFIDLAETYKDKLLKGKLSYNMRKGKVYQELAAYIKQCHCCLLIVGAHGSSGFEEYWIGTNAFRIVSSATCPVITVKYNYDIQRGIRKMLLPIDHSQQTIQKIVFAADLAKCTGADINILAINSSNLKSMQKVIDNNVAKIKKHLDLKGVNYYIDTISSKNLAADILRHAYHIDADLITIMTDTLDQASSIMLGPYAQQLVNYSPLPVLSIHPKDNFSIN